LEQVVQVGEPQAQKDVLGFKSGRLFAKGRTVKKDIEPFNKKHPLNYLQDVYSVCLMCCCQVIGLVCSMWFYNSKKDVTAVIDTLCRFVEELQTCGSMYISNSCGRRQHVE
jgi:hypothetical protein